MAIGRVRAGLAARPLTELPASGAARVLVAAFDARRIVDRIRHLLPAGAEAVTLDAARLPDALLTNPRRYLDRLNFATNFAFFPLLRRAFDPARHGELLGRLAMETENR